jgi:hypothetical protein
MNMTDLTQRPPRSPRLKLGGYVILPRMLDKGRATITGKNGEYHFACPLDQRFLDFTGIESAKVLDQLKQGKSDTEILAWVREQSKRTDFEIYAWSEYQTQRSPSDIDGREFVNESVKAVAPERDDIVTWFDLLDLDDYVSFGGQG